MSAITSMPGRRAASQKADERRKVLILGILAVVLVVLLAFELPKLLKSSSSSAGTASTAASTTATAVGAASSPAGVSSVVVTKRLRVIRHMSAKDPFVPLVHESTTSSAAPTSTGTPAAAPTVRFTGRATATHVKPVHVKPTAPIAAVIWTNGKRQVVGLSQVFSVGDVPFRLVGVTPKAMRIEVVGGKFAGAKRAISVRKGHRVKLVNTATGVAYRLLFTRGTANAPSASIALASTSAGKN
jgi:hypothetical protein